jgi:hypothetical protein
LVNAVKHNQGRLRGVLIYDDHVVVPGFYVETAPDGIVGPDKNIHDGGETAISFYRDIRYHYAEFYLVSDALACAVSAIIGESAEDIAEDKEEPIDIGVAERIVALPETCFLNEVGKHEPLLRIFHGDRGAPEIVIGHGPPSWRFKALLDFEIHVQFEGDGVTKSFKLPYSGDVFNRLTIRRLSELKRRTRHLQRDALPFFL